MRVFRSALTIYKRSGAFGAIFDPLEFGPRGEDMSKKDFAIDKNNIQEKLELIIREIHDNEDPEELNLYRAMFRKHVSLFRRGYVAAYLLKYMQGGVRPSVRKSTITDLVTPFIGIGKSRRVYPKDLVGLILDTTSAQKEDIGIIKILDNYSFVEVAPEHGENIINTLNGMTYRGRTLNVNFAKKKD